LGCCWGKSLAVEKVVFYSRDYCMLSYPNEKIEVDGVVEEVKTKSGKKYHRIVIGYFDTYTSDRRDTEYIKTVEG